MRVLVLRKRKRTRIAPEEHLKFQLSTSFGKLSKAGVVIFGKGLTSFSNSSPCFTCENAEVLRSVGSQACVLAETRAGVSCCFFQLSACASMEAKLRWVPGEERGVEVVFTVSWSTDTEGDGKVWETRDDTSEGRPLWTRHTSKGRAVSWLIEDLSIWARSKLSQILRDQSFQRAGKDSIVTQLCSLQRLM